MARVSTKTAKPSQAKAEAFKSMHSSAHDQLERFVHSLRTQETSDEDDEIIAGMVDAAGTSVLGIWLELHRIADALQTIAQPLADMIEEAHA